MKEILLNIQNLLKENVPTLKYIDENWGQLSTEYGDMPPVKFPCALIEIKAVEWQNVAHPHQQGTATLTLLIADIRLTNSSMNAPKTQQDNAYKINTLLHQNILLSKGFVIHIPFSLLF